MTFNYGGNPGSSYLDAVRFLVQDTNPSRQKLSDEEIAGVLSLEGGVTDPQAAPSRGVLYQVAAFCCDVIATKFSEEASYSVGGLSESANQKANEYAKRGDHYRKLAARGAVPFLGGRSKAAKVAAAQDADAVQPAIRVGMHDEPGADVLDDGRR